MVFHCYYEGQEYRAEIGQGQYGGKVLKVYMLDENNEPIEKYQHKYRSDRDAKRGLRNLFRGAEWSEVAHD